MAKTWHDSAVVIAVLAFVQVGDGRGGILEGNPKGEALLLTFPICKIAIFFNDVMFCLELEIFLAALSHTSINITKCKNVLAVLI